MQKQNDIWQELKELDSPLADMSKAMPYQIPEAYFHELPETVAACCYELPEASRSLPFDVPAQYFDTLPAVLLEQVKNTAGTQRRSLWRQWQLAAAAILLIGIGFGIYAINAPRSNFETQLAQLNKEGLLDAYVQEHIDEFDSELIEQAYVKNEAAPSPEKLEEKDIVDYLNENGWQ